MSAIKANEKGVVISVKVQPRASRDEVCGEAGDAVRIRLCAPPVDGKANKALIEFLAEVLGVSRSAITMLSGDTGRNKRVMIRGMTAQDAAARLAGCK